MFLSRVFCSGEEAEVPQNTILVSLPGLREGLLVQQRPGTGWNRLEEEHLTGVPAREPLKKEGLQLSESSWRDLKGAEFLPHRGRLTDEDPGELMTSCLSQQLNG